MKDKIPGERPPLLSAEEDGCIAGDGGPIANEAIDCDVFASYVILKRLDSKHYHERSEE